MGKKVAAQLQNGSLKQNAAPLTTHLRITNCLELKKLKQVRILFYIIIFIIT